MTGKYWLIAPHFVPRRREAIEVMVQLRRESRERFVQRMKQSGAYLILPPVGAAPVGTTASEATCQRILLAAAGGFLAGVLLQSLLSRWQL